MANANLGIAKKAKGDEFYTQWVDIEREMNAYLEFDPDIFRGKTILLPCDDPEWSNFTKFFAHHFTEYGIKKLISTSYAPTASGGKGEFYAPTLFEIEDDKYEPEKSKAHGRVFTLTAEDVNGDGKVDFDDLRWDYLEGDGDFLSREVTAMRDEADIVITNPPFSKFRKFITWLTEGDVQFSVIGPKNAITYIEVFPHIKNNRLWLGKGFHRGDAYFKIPNTSKSDYAEGVFDAESSTVHFRNVGWFTNIEHGLRHEPLNLMSMQDNLNFSKWKVVREDGYQKYDNYDAVDVRYVDAIPSDYHGLMGVPITFLDHYNPDQFEIIGSFNAGADGESIGATYSEMVSKGKTMIWNGPIVQRTPRYKRIVIRHRKPLNKEA